MWRTTENIIMDNTFRSLFNDQTMLARLATTYGKFCWEGWKSTKKIGTIFQGETPVGLTLEKADGSMITTMGTERIRVRDLGPASLVKLGILADAPGAEDVYHPEFTFDYTALGAKSRMYLANNEIPVVNFFMWLADEVSTEETTLDEIATLCEAMLKGDRCDLVQAHNQAIRYGWVARKVIDGDVANKDFRPSCRISADASAIDTYVIGKFLPVFIADVREGKYSK